MNAIVLEISSATIPSRGFIASSQEHICYPKVPSMRKIVLQSGPTSTSAFSTILHQVALCNEKMLVANHNLTLEWMSEFLADVYGDPWASREGQLQVDAKSQ